MREMPFKPGFYISAHIVILSEAKKSLTNSSGPSALENPRCFALLNMTGQGVEKPLKRLISLQRW
jgi:hypothetical protein